MGGRGRASPRKRRAMKEASWRLEAIKDDVRGGGRGHAKSGRREAARRASGSGRSSAASQRCDPKHPSSRCRTRLTR